MLLLIWHKLFFPSLSINLPKVDRNLSEWANNVNIYGFPMNVHQKVALAEEDFNKPKWIGWHILWIPATFPQLHQSSPDGLINKVTRMEVIPKLSNMDSQLPSLTWLCLVLSANLSTLSSSYGIIPQGD